MDTSSVKKFAFTVATGVTIGLIMFILQEFLGETDPGSPSTTSEFSPTPLPPPLPPTPTSSSQTRTSSIPSTTASTPKISTLPSRTMSTLLPYRADWSTGIGRWIGSEDWKAVDGKLISSGTSYGESIIAPVQLDSTQHYAVEAQIQLIRYSQETFTRIGSFGVVVRTEPNGGGYGAGWCVSAGLRSCEGPTDSVARLWNIGNGKVLHAEAVKQDNEVHRYRVEVQGTELTVLIDGEVILTASDSSYLTNKRVGLWSDRAQISVLSFEVTSL